MIQQWCCYKCGMSGAVAHLKHAYPYTVMNSVADDHAAKSPECGDLGILRLRNPNPKLCDRKAWEEVKKNARRLSRQRIVEKILTASPQS